MGSRQFSDISHAEIYSIYRPDIPEEIVRRIVSYLRDKFHGFLDQAVDVGCGSGQSTVPLAPFFKHVFGIDGSKAQIEEAMNSRIWPNITFNVGPAEKLPFADNSVQLVTACASLHWFEQRAFFSEIRRILSPDGVFAAYTYHYIKPFSENKECVEQIDRLFAEKCKELNVYYSKEVFSSLNKYRDVDFPFEEVLRPSDIRQKVYGRLDDVTGYIKSLSGFQNMKKDDSQKADNYILDFDGRLKEILKLEEENQNIPLYRDFYLVFCRKGV